MRCISHTGSIALHLLVVFPVLLSLVLLVSDISRFYSERENLQKTVDELALHAAHALPDTRGTSQIIESRVKTLNRTGVSALHSINDYRIEITLSRRFVPALASMFPTRPIEVSATSGATLRPLDYVLILPDGLTLRPGFIDNQLETLEQPWGSDIDWPASSYFQLCPIPIVQRAGMADASLRTNPSLSRWVTQSCVNPVFLPIKQAATRLVDSIMATGINRIALLWMPGDSPELGVTSARDLTHPPTTLPESRWSVVREFPINAGDELCRALSGPQQDEHLLPSTCPFPSAGGFCLSPVSQSSSISNCYFETSLRLKEAIDWHAARLGDARIHPEAVLKALERSVSEFASAEADSHLLASRGNLKAYPLRRVVIITDILPEIDVSTPPRAFDLLKALNVRVSLFFVENSYSVHTRNYSQARARDSMRRYAESRTASGDESFSYSEILGVDDIGRTLFAETVLRDHQVVLRR